MAARKTSPKQAEPDAAQATPPTEADKLPGDKAAAPEQPEAVLVVTAPRPRRRAGFAFGRDPVRLRLSQLSDEQLLAIESDPLLSVRHEQA